MNIFVSFGPSCLSLAVFHVNSFVILCILVLCSVKAVCFTSAFGKLVSFFVHFFLFLYKTKTTYTIAFSMHVHALSLTIQSERFCHYVRKKMSVKADCDTSVLSFFSCFCFLTRNKIKITDM